MLFLILASGDLHALVGVAVDVPIFKGLDDIAVKTLMVVFQSRGLAVPIFLKPLVVLQNVRGGEVVELLDAAKGKKGTIHDFTSLSGSTFNVLCMKLIIHEGNECAGFTSGQVFLHLFG